jgi:hypothetical protein
MTLSGHVKNGIIVSDTAVELPEGTAVQIEVSAPITATNTEIPTLYERLKPFFGVLDGLPEDASTNLKHYLYGHPKQE